MSAMMRRLGAACVAGVWSVLAAAAPPPGASSAHPLTVPEQQELARLMRCDVPFEELAGPGGERFDALYAKLFAAASPEDQVNGAQSTHPIAVWGDKPGTLFMRSGLAAALPVVWMEGVTFDQIKALLAARGVALAFDSQQSANQPYRVYSGRVTVGGGPVNYMLADMRVVGNSHVVGPGVTVSCVRVQEVGPDGW